MLKGSYAVAPVPALETNRRIQFVPSHYQHTQMYLGFLNYGLGKDNDSAASGDAACVPIRLSGIHWVTATSSKSGSALARIYSATLDAAPLGAGSDAQSPKGFSLRMRHTSRISCSDSNRAFFCNRVWRLIAFFKVLFKICFWSFNAFCSSFNRRMSSCKFTALPTDPLFPTAAFSAVEPCPSMPQPSSAGQADVPAKLDSSVDMVVVSWVVAMAVDALSQKPARCVRHASVMQQQLYLLGAVLPIVLV